MSDGQMAQATMAQATMAPRSGSWHGQPRGRLCAALAFSLGAALVASGAAAQGVPLSVELLAGSCAQPDTRAATLAGGADRPWSALAPQLGAVTDALGGSVLEGETTVDASLVDIAGSAHAIDVRTAESGAGAGLACGELGAFEPRGADVQVGLGGADGVGHGVAWLHDNGDGTTTVSVVVAAPATVGPETATWPVEVVIVKSVYGPDPVEVAPGTTVTWFNEDRTPHTATAVDHAFDSGYMAQGATWSRTFDTPGTYAYFCLYHPRMRGTVIVD
jgi:plastocyanin